MKLIVHLVITFGSDILLSHFLSADYITNAVFSSVYKCEKLASLAYQ